MNSIHIAGVGTVKLNGTAQTGVRIERFASDDLTLTWQEADELGRALIESSRVARENEMDDFVDPTDAEIGQALGVLSHINEYSVFDNVTGEWIA